MVQNYVKEIKCMKAEVQTKNGCELHYQS